jgi:serine/threonine-protein kinase
MRKTLGIRIGEVKEVAFPFVGNPHPIAVREGINFLSLVGNWKKLPDRTVLTVNLYFADRIYGRVTQARTPSGDTFPVCMELLDVEDRKRGALIEPGSGPEKVLVYSLAYVKAVEEFE